MRLLILTQAIDTKDPFLGFFHGWVAQLAPHFDQVHVVCLKEGQHTLPRNVTVHSLGKEDGVSRVKYVSRFYAYAWNLRGAYDAVLVHQNQEYVLLGGVLWGLLGKPVYLWRNHYKGSFLTRVAAFLSRKVFYTSMFSYTAGFKNAKQMPVGVDTELFTPQASVRRRENSVLFYARLAPSKYPDVFIDALRILRERGVPFSAVVRGTPLPKDAQFAHDIRNSAAVLALDGNLKFEPGAPHSEGPRIFSEADIFVNLGASGMYDKTIFEAAACGCLTVASSKDYAALAGAGFSFAERDAQSLAEALEALLRLPIEQKQSLSARMRALAESQSLAVLISALRKALNG